MEEISKHRMPGTSTILLGIVLGGAFAFRSLAYCNELSLLLFIPVPWIIALTGTLVGLVVMPFNAALSKRVIKGSCLLTVTLAISGVLFTTLWSCWVYGNLYQDFDFIPGLDVSPFWLLIGYGLENPGQYFHGWTKETIFALWSLYGLLCWGTAIGMTCLFMKPHKRNISAN